MTDTPMTDAEREAYRKGLLRAAEMCEAKREVHREYVLDHPHTAVFGRFHARPNPRFDGLDMDHAATCGRRDECERLAIEIREEAEKVT